ncbi:MAG: DUF2339 domain-containing protein, partial [Coriobacteriia bacterium]|nr:DUF2339 domain-containing protein [Coriobacteriia bacterium]
PLESPAYPPPPASSAYPPPLGVPLQPAPAMAALQPTPAMPTVQAAYPIASVSPAYPAPLESPLYPAPLGAPLRPAAIFADQPSTTLRPAAVLTDPVSTSLYPSPASAYQPSTSPYQPPAPTYPPPASLHSTAASAYPPPSTLFPPPQSFQDFQQKKPSRSMENLVGRNIIGIIAAILVFLGLIFLGVLVIPALTDTIKIILMYLLSSILTVVGVVLTMRKKNYFTSALLGCGCGSFFISILLTHMYFNAIGDIAAFAFLLVWMAISLVLLKLSNSLLVSILIHIGMIVSLCVAYFGGINQINMLFIVVYQLLSIVLITIGNVICYQKTYRLGLAVSLFLSLIAVIAMFFSFELTQVLVGSESIIVTRSALIIQVVSAAVLSYLLFVSTRQIESKAKRILLHVLNKALFIGILFVTVCLASGLFFGGLFPYQGFGASPSMYYMFLTSTGVTLVIALTHAFISVFLQKKLKGDTALETISVIMMCAYAGLLLVCIFYLGSNAYQFGAVFRFPGLIVLTIAFLIFNRLTKRPLYSLLALCVMGADFTLMLSHGYSVLVEYGTLYAALGYMLVYGAILAYLWRTLDVRLRQSQKLLTALKICSLGIFEFSVFSIFGAAYINAVYVFLVFTAAFLGMFALRLDVRESVPRGYWVFIRIHEIVLALVSSYTLFFLKDFGDSSLRIPCILLSLFTLALLVCALIRVKVAGERKISWIGCLLGIAFTVLVLGTIYGQTSWFDEPYVLSIVCMATALVCVAAGFVTNVKPLRLYGLILVIICVLKLVTFDFASIEYLMRVIAFIGGGVICFGISALYSYAVKRFDEKAKEDNLIDEETGL